MAGGKAKGCQPPTGYHASLQLIQRDLAVAVEVELLKDLGDGALSVPKRQQVLLELPLTDRTIAVEVEEREGALSISSDGLLILARLGLSSGSREDGKPPRRRSLGGREVCRSWREA